MSSKFKLIISALGLYISSAFGATLANDAPAADQQINKRVDCLQAQINKLRTGQMAQQKKTPPRGRTANDRAKGYHSGRSRQYHGSASRLSVGPYLNEDATFDGSELVINVPTVREDSQLLLQQYQFMQECHEFGMHTPDLPRVTLTGKLEGQTSYGSTYTDSRSGNINFNSAELDTYVQGNSWVSGYMTMDYNPDEHRDSSRLLMNRAFIAVGNLGQFPLYTSIGQVYVPFGRYSSRMVTTPVTQTLGRTRARTLTLGYQQTGNNVFHAEVYGFRGLTNSLSCDNKNNEWGTGIGYRFNNGGRVSGEVGAGYISNLADSQGVQGTVFLNTENLRHRVPALNVYGALTINPVVFLAEYVGAVRSFDVNDVSFIKQGARPTAFHTEASYTFKTSSKHSSIGVGYGRTSQALTLGLPQVRYSVFYNINIWRDTNLALEYRHDVNYSVSTISTGSNPIPADLVTGLGKSDNVITAQFDLFF